MKKRVMHLLSSNKYSGAENVAATIIENTNNSLEIVYVSPSGPIEDALRRKGIKYIGIKELNIYNIRKLIKTWKPDIIHAHDFRASIISSLSTLSIPIISHIHQNPIWFSKVNFKTISYFFSCFIFKKIILASDSILEHNQILNSFLKKILILENVVDIKDTQQKSLEYSTEYYDVIFLGRLESVKDPLRFIKIIGKIVDYIPNFKAVMIGDGELKKECEEAIKVNKLEKSIIMKGFVPNPYPYLKNSKLLVMTSKSEGRPMVALESMALGKPIIASNFEGVDKLINENNGYICYDNPSMRDKIIYLTENHKKYKELTNHLTNYAKNKLDIDPYIETFLKIYYEL